VSVLFDNIDLFAKGFWLTLQVCILSAIGAVIIGTVVAVLRISPIPPLRWLGTAYVTVFRNAPAGLIYPGDPGFPKGNTGLNTQWTNLSPRAGVAWDVHGDGRLAVRSSYSMGYDFMPGE